MDGKLPLVAGYLCLLTAFALVPSNAIAGSTNARVWRWPLPVLVGAACALALGFVLPRMAAGWTWLLLPLASAATFLVGLRGQRTVSGGLALVAASCISLLLLWWVPVASLPRASINTALVVWCTLGIGLGLTRPLSFGRAAHALTVLALVAACWALMRFGGFETRSQWLVAWHHWGAYWGPVETIRAGLVPFHDVPIQYGAGPTALLSLMPDRNGFNGMRHIVMLMSLVGVAVVVDCCLLAVRPLRNVFASLVAGFAGAVACMLWIASPNDVSSAMTTPSTFALRFVPIFVLLWILVRFPHRPRAALIAWAACTLWSVEAAFYAFVVYWPSRLQLDDVKSLRQLGSRVLRLGLQAMVALLALVALWAVAYWLIFGVGPSLRLYVLYALFPPGPMPVNWRGPVLWLLFIFVMAGVALTSRRVSAPEKRVIRLTSLCLAACASYFLGRSHDNNIINLMPAAVMLVCAIVGQGREAAVPAHASRVLLAASLAFLPFFGFAAWKDMRPAPRHAWSHQMSFLQGAFYPPALVDAIRYVREERNEFFEVIDEGPLNFQPYGAQGVWNALHPLSNFPFVPSADRLEMLKRGAARLKRPGWLIVQDSRRNDPVIADFEQAYRVTETRRFGSFIATRLIPVE